MGKKIEMFDAVTSNYFHVVPNSYFWTDLEQLIYTIEMSKYPVPEGTINLMPKVDVDYILIGLKNTLKNGYNLSKTSTDENTTD